MAGELEIVLEILGNIQTYFSGKDIHIDGLNMNNIHDWSEYSAMGEDNIGQYLATVKSACINFYSFVSKQVGLSTTFTEDQYFYCGALLLLAAYKTARLIVEDLPPISERGISFSVATATIPLLQEMKFIFLFAIPNPENSANYVTILLYIEEFMKMADTIFP